MCSVVEALAESKGVRHEAESHTVNAAFTRNEGYCSYEGRSARYATMWDKVS